MLTGKYHVILIDGMDYSKIIESMFLTERMKIAWN